MRALIVAIIKHIKKYWAISGLFGFCFGNSITPVIDAIQAGTWATISLTHWTFVGTGVFAVILIVLFVQDKITEINNSITP